MDVTPLLKPTQKIIQSYAHGKFRVSGEVFDGPVIVGVDFAQSWENPASLNDPSQFAFLRDRCDVLIIGTGEKAALLLPAQRQGYRELGFNVEMMDTGAACRTFNVLTADGRKVAAALLPVS